MKRKIQNVFSGLVLTCCLLSSSHFAYAQHATNYGVVGITAVTEQQAAPTLVSGANNDFTVQTVTDGPDTDILVTSTDKVTGVITWSFQYGAVNVDEAGFSMVRGLPGTLIIVGHRNEIGQQVDNYVLCINDAGVVLWDLQFGSDEGYESSRLVIDAKGVAGTNAFVVAGVTRNNPINNFRPMAYAVDGLGNLLWHARYGGAAPPDDYQYYIPTSMVINENLEVVIAGDAHDAGGPSSLFTMAIDGQDGSLLLPEIIHYDVLGDLSEERFPSIIRAENNQGYAMSFNAIFGGGIERIGLMRLDNNRFETWTQFHWVSGEQVQRPINLTLKAGNYEMSLFLKDVVGNTVGNPGVLRVMNIGNFIQGTRYSGFNCENVQHTFSDITGAFLGKVSQSLPAVFGLYRTNNLGGFNICSEAILDANFSQFNSTTIPFEMEEGLEYEIDILNPGVPVVIPAMISQMVCFTSSSLLLDETTAVDQQGVEQALLQVYPNPSQGNVTMSITKTVANGSVQIIDPLGRIVFQEELSAGTFQVDLSKKAKGFYTILMRTGQEVTSHKLLIE